MMRTITMVFSALLMVSANGNAWGQVQYTVTDLGKSAQRVVAPTSHSHQQQRPNRGIIGGFKAANKATNMPFSTAGEHCKTSARSAGPIALPTG